MRRSDWGYVRLAGAALLTLVSIHGVTSARWRQLHTAGTLLSLAATFGPLLVEER